MRVVAERTEAICRGQKSKQGELEDHLRAYERLAEQALQNEADPPICTLVLRSAKSVPVRALTDMQHMLAEAGVVVKAILSTVEPEQDLHMLFAALAALLPDDNLETHVRWARNPRLLDAHEQAVYGKGLAWTGDALRRQADKRNRLTLFDNTPEAQLRGTRAFDALWAASERVPTHLLDVHAAEGTTAAASKTTSVPLAGAAPTVEGWPLLRN